MKDLQALTVLDVLSDIARRLFSPPSPLGTRDQVSIGSMEGSVQKFLHQGRLKSSSKADSILEIV